MRNFSQKGIQRYIEKENIERLRYTKDTLKSQISLTGVPKEENREGRRWHG